MTETIAPHTVCCDVGSALDNANAKMKGFCKEHYCPLYEELKDIVFPTPADAADEAYQESVDTWIAEHMEEINAALIDDYIVLIQQMVAISDDVIEALDETPPEDEEDPEENV